MSISEELGLSIFSGERSGETKIDTFCVSFATNFGDFSTRIVVFDFSELVRGKLFTVFDPLSTIMLLLSMLMFAWWLSIVSGTPCRS